MMVSAGALVAQVLEFASLEKDWTVCANRPITMKVINTSGGLLQNNSVTLHLPCERVNTSRDRSKEERRSTSPISSTRLGSFDVQPGQGRHTMRGYRDLLRPFPV